MYTHDKFFIFNVLLSSFVNVCKNSPKTLNILAPCFGLHNRIDGEGTILKVLHNRTDLVKPSMKGHFQNIAQIY